MDSIKIGNHVLRTPPLTKDQHQALLRLIEFLRENLNVPTQRSKVGSGTGGKGSGLFMLLEGSAGTGKTFLMQLLVRYNNMLGPNRQRILGAALTHKARKVLQRSLNYEGCTNVVPTKTISALLKKQRLNSYLGTKKYGAGGNGLNDLDLVIIDEASMIDDRDLQQLVSGARTHRTKILFVGDSAQIPHPTQKLELVDSPPSLSSTSKLLVKADSAAFRLLNRAELKEIVRQKAGNPLLNVAKHIRENLYYNELSGPYVHDDCITSSGIPSSRGDHGGTDQGVCFVSPMTFENRIFEDFLNWDKWHTPYEARIIAYTNQAVSGYNRLARNARFAGNQKVLDVPFGKGDLLMGYSNIGWPTPYIENGQDYLVTRVRREEKHPIALDGGKQVLSPGYLVTFGEAPIDKSTAGKSNVNVKAAMQPIPGTSTTQFFPIPDDDRNLEVLIELRKRAQKVNKPNSGSKVYKHYRELKDQLLFMESLYEYKGRIWSESDFKREHPLLSTKVTELIMEDEDGVAPPSSNALDVAPGGTGRRSIRTAVKLYDQFRTLYPNLVEERALNRHMLGPNEEFGDRFLIIDKDMDYGYSVTAHKSQGSTYDRVYIDDVDLSKIRDRWNYEYGDYYRSSKERNQLKYVALTRARYLATILSCYKNEPEGSGPGSEPHDENYSPTDSEGFGPEFV